MFIFNYISYYSGCVEIMAVIHVQIIKPAYEMVIGNLYV